MSKKTKRIARFIKRLIDIVFSLVLLVIISPLFALIILAILWEDGKPVFFLQKRLGIHGRVFLIRKFRSMVVNAEKQGAGIFIEPQDSRITRTGRWLRKTSLDELPQLMNVLKGEMSFIGPRPPLPYYPKSYGDYEPWVKERFSMRPGITGLAQVHGRNEIDWYERFRWDLIYVQKWTLCLDLSILFQTFTTVFKAKGIYGKNQTVDGQNNELQKKPTKKEPPS